MRKFFLYFLIVCAAATAWQVSAADAVPSEPAAEAIVEETAEAPVFSDIAGHPAEAIIRKYKEAGIINGYPDGTFRPNEYITRVEIAKIVTLAFGLTDTTEYSYKDTVSDAWYAPYLAAAVSYIPDYSPGIYSMDTIAIQMMYYGKDGSQGYFLPDDLILRMHFAETVSLLKMKHYSLNVEIPDFFVMYEKNNELFGDWQYDDTYNNRLGIPMNIQLLHTYTWLAQELGIMQADADGNFLPYGFLTRAEALTIIDRILTEE